MPYANREEQLAAQRRNYEANKGRHRKKVLERRQAIQQWFLEYKKTLKCNRCPENYVACLEFHHKNPDNKLESLGHEGIGLMALKGYSIESIKAEIAKCEVLCANCHRKEHFDEDSKKRVK